LIYEYKTDLFEYIFIELLLVVGFWKNIFLYNVNKIEHVNLYKKLSNSVEKAMITIYDFIHKHKFTNKIDFDL
jgi:hypothetical protein